MSKDTIYRQDAIEEIDEWIKAFLENGHKESAADACLIQDGIIQLPSAQPDEEKVSNILYNIYRNTSPHTSAEGVVAIKYYIAEIWREIFGEEGPIWLKK